MSLQLWTPLADVRDVTRCGAYVREIRCERVDPFEIIGEIKHVEIIASGHGIRDLAILQKRFGKAAWRKLKGIATVRLAGGRVEKAEVHWYEAHGIGKRWVKIKRYLD